jgi:hypothetical protein
VNLLHRRFAATRARIYAYGPFEQLNPRYLLKDKAGAGRRGGWHAICGGKRAVTSHRRKDWKAIYHEPMDEKTNRAIAGALRTAT